MGFAFWRAAAAAGFLARRWASCPATGRRRNSPTTRSRSACSTISRANIASTIAWARSRRCSIAVEEFGGKIDGVPIEVIYGDHQNKPDVGALDRE